MTAPLVRGRATGRGPGGPARPAPGVAVEWVGPLFRQAGDVRGDIAGFAGAAVRGPVGVPLRLSAAAEFDDAFGPPAADSFLADAVHGFFANGGETCWVVRVARDATTATAVAPGIAFAAHSPGAWANHLRIELRPSAGDRFTLTLTAPDGRREVWRNLTAETLPERFDPKAELPQGKSQSTMSVLVEAKIVDGTITAFDTQLLGGHDGETTADDLAVAAVFEEIDEIGLVAVPDLAAPRFDPGVIGEAQARLAAACEERHDRTALLNHPDPDALADDVIGWRQRFTTAFAAIYWPWLRTAGVRAIPPCGHVAGVVSRSDQAAGPHKPPANEPVLGVVGVTVPVDDERHGQVNEAQVNAIRVVPGRGIRVAGARTTSGDTQWRYLNVRRLFTHVQRTLAGRAAWLVFEPDNQGMRDNLERVTRQYLDELWRDGALDGRTEEEAYRVRIGDEFDGRLIVEIGLRPPWPAEFVVARIDVPVLAEGGGRAGDR
ncbi:phage tail sheath subtilisin-like domain-containing protein [Actinoplanes missouriensis]|uniref:phage tail sheath family protein n=1 Tax=Actinoplanes missouriensis TaxID=1866 RepID=UPI0033FFCBE9